MSSILTLTDPDGGTLRVNFRDAINVTTAVAGIDDYTGWPWNCAKYDSSRDAVKMVSTSGGVHNEMGGPSTDYDKQSWIYTKASASTENMEGTSTSFAAPVSIYSEAEGTSCMTQAFTIKADGDYACVVGRVDHPNNWVGTKDAIFRTSDDGGATWAGTAMTGHGSSYPCGMIELSSGRLLACTPQQTTFSGEIITVQKIIRSDDDGSTWVSTDLNGSLHQPDSTSNEWNWEPCFTQLSNGNILLTLRGDRAIGDSDYFALWSISRDGGEIWSPLKSTNLSMQANPVDVSELPDGRLLAIAGSRHASEHGLYAAITTQSNAARGVWGTAQQIITGISDSNFGYPAICHDGLSRVWLYYYSGITTDTDIFEIRATFTTTTPTAGATWFDGSDDVITIASTDLDNTHSLSFKAQSVGDSATLFSKSGAAGGNYRIYIDVTDNFVVRINGDATFSWDLSSLAINEERFYEIVRDGTSCTLSVDGVSQGTIAGGQSNAFPIQTFGGYAGYSTSLGFVKGTMYDVELKTSGGVVFGSWAGDSNENSAWADPVGGKDGTVGGSPVNATKILNAWEIL